MGRVVESSTTRPIFVRGELSGCRLRRNSGSCLAAGDLHDRQDQRGRGRRRHHRRLGCNRSQTLVAAALGGTQVGLPLVRPQRGRTLGLSGNGQRRIHAEVGRDRCAVDNAERRVAVHAVVRIDDAVIGIRRDSATAEEVRRQWNVEDLAPRAARDAVDLLGNSTRRLVASGIHVGFG